MDIRLFFILLVLFTAATSRAIIELDLCITPNQENGTCVPLYECDVLLTGLSDLTFEASQFVQNSKCGLKQNLVCCGTLSYLKTDTYTSNLNVSATAQLLANDIDLSVLSDKSVCGLDATRSSKASDRIKGGTMTNLEEFPWLAALEYVVRGTSDSKGIKCGGSLINKRYVLTAAHCIEHADYEVSKAWFGVLNVTDVQENCLYLNDTKLCIHSVQKHKVIEQISHPDYGEHKRNDIGLLQLDNDIEFTKYIRPICLPSPNSASSKIGIYLTVTGWGAIDGTGKTSDVKLKVKVPVRSNYECNKILEEDLTITPNQLCAGGEDGKDSCKGDSGGPLMRRFKNIQKEIRWYQEGIVSFGVDCGKDGYPAVYTLVSSYVEWIEKRILPTYDNSILLPITRDALRTLSGGGFG